MTHPFISHHTSKKGSCRPMMMTMEQMRTPSIGDVSGAMSANITRKGHLRKRTHCMYAIEGFLSLFLFVKLFIVLYCIVFINFYSASHSMSFQKRSRPQQLELCRSLHAEALHAIASEGLAQVHTLRLERDSNLRPTGEV